MKFNLRGFETTGSYVRMSPRQQQVVKTKMNNGKTKNNGTKK